jgi:hypothetical protein
MGNCERHDRLQSLLKYDHVFSVAIAWFMEWNVVAGLNKHHSMKQRGSEGGHTVQRILILGLNGDE